MTVEYALSIVLATEHEMHQNDRVQIVPAQLCTVVEDFVDMARKGHNVDVQQTWLTRTINARDVL